MFRIKNYLLLFCQMITPIKFEFIFGTEFIKIDRSLIDQSSMLVTSANHPPFRTMSHRDHIDKLLFVGKLFARVHQ